MWVLVVPVFAVAVVVAARLISAPAYARKVTFEVPTRRRWTVRWYGHDITLATGWRGRRVRVGRRRVAHESGNQGPAELRGSFVDRDGSTASASASCQCETPK